MAEKQQVFKVESAKKMFYCDLYSNLFSDAFLYFKLLQPAIFETFDLRKGYVHLRKALKEEKLTQSLKIGVEGDNI